MTNPELIMIPIPAIGHLPPIFEFSKRLVSRNDRLSVTIVLIRTPFTPEVDSFSDSLAASCDPNRIKFIRISGQSLPSPESILSIHTFFPQFLDSHKDAVREALLADRANRGSPVSTVVGVVADILTTAVVEEVGKELGVPTYLFYPSSAAFLGQLLRFPAEFRPEVAAGDPDGEIMFPSYVNPVPNKLLPSIMLDGEGYASVNDHIRRFRGMKGIVLNSYLELEARAAMSLEGKDMAGNSLPPVFCVGPVIDAKGQGKLGEITNSSVEKIMTWLDDQPRNSVVLLCFGSVGSFSDAQLKEIAAGLELAEGQRFLWVIREAPSKEALGMPKDYLDYSESGGLAGNLGEGFLERTKGRGIVCGWVPQAAVLAHEAVGGFVSHCGWNSVLESLWHAVPVLAWPMYAEQQMNAFYLVTELGLAVEMRVDYRMEEDTVVKGDEIAEKIERVMVDGRSSETRRKVKEMSEAARRAVVEGGSSFDAFGGFVDLVLKNKAID
ncbi:unnamed protein product [Linum tenue]|uniref:Glycosyltransferase n=1 Tax=Linum tenue TaxID=586396 RepID=A0AAV0GNE1_9ROSI|nr:unnamed protein product [Linum tenue]